jgi:hypothetical protein
MQGLMFNLVQQVVVSELGDRTWQQIVAGSGVRSEYSPEGAYSHEEFLHLVQETSIALSRSADETLVWFARRSIPIFASQFPELFDGHDSAIGFVLTLNDVIHPEVRGRYPDAFLPTFEFDRVADDTLIIAYASYRDLCPFAQGLLLGAADHYGETATVEHFHCQRRGDRRCAMLLRVSPD